MHITCLRVVDFCIHGGKIDAPSARLPPSEKRSPRGEQTNLIADALGVFLAEKNRGAAAKPPAPPGRLSSWDRSFLVMQSASEFL